MKPKTRIPGGKGGKITFDVDSYKPNVKTWVEKPRDEPKVAISIVFEESYHKGSKQFKRGIVKVYASEAERYFKQYQKTGKHPQYV